METKKCKNEYVRVISLSGALYVLIPHDYAVKHNIEKDDYVIRVRKDDAIEYKLMEEYQK